MSMIFYDYKMAPSPRRARITLAEKNIPHKVVQIDMMKNEQMDDAFRAINPNCTVPALQLEEGRVLTTNAGIAVYLEEMFPTPPLFGTTPLEKAEIASWQSQIEQDFAMAVAHALRNINPAMKNRALPGPHNYEQIPALAERGLAQIDVFFERFNQHLEGRDFVVGASLSIADITAACTVDFAKVVRKKPAQEHSNILKWRAGLAQRPSFQL